LATTNAEKDSIALNVLAWVDSVTIAKSRISTGLFKGRIVRNLRDLKNLYWKLMNVEEFAFDTEFSSLRYQYKGESEFVGCSFSWGKKENYYVPVGHLEDDEEDQIELKQFVAHMRKVFAREDVRVIGHNLKAEIHALNNIGVEIKTKDLFDTLVAVWNIDENNEVNLKSITKRYYNYNQTEFKHLLYTIPKRTLDEYGFTSHTKANVSIVKIAVVAPYAMDDTYWTWQIYLDIQDALEDEEVEPYFYKRQMPYLTVLKNMERRGVRVDFNRLNEMSRMAEKDLEDLEYKVYEIAGVEFNIGSNQQLAEILFGYKKQKPIYHIDLVPIIDKKTGEQELYKAGAKKGQPKWKEVKDKNRIVGYEESYDKVLVENSFGFPIGKETAQGMPKTGNDELEELSKKKYKRDKRKAEGIKMIQYILRYKRLAKLKSTYMEGLAEQVYSDGKIHTSFNQTGTTSGRLSSSGPNLQNLPRAIEKVDENPPPKEKFDNEDDYKKAYAGWKHERKEYEFWRRYEIRDAFIPDKWINDPGVKEGEQEVIVACDYSNLEMRILAHFCQDPKLISMFETNADVHGQTAVDMYKLNCTHKEAKKLYPHLRQNAKALNFLLVYGGTAIALSQTLGIKKAEGQELYDLYFETYKGVKEFMRQQKKFGHQNEYVPTVLGRRRHLEGINSNDFKTVGYFERLAVNSPVQGSAADIAISAQLLIEEDEELKRLGYRQILQVHDEIVGICPKKNKEAVMKRKTYLMANCLPMPLDNVLLNADADYGDSYAEAK
jgi:DNA polymerase I-like protein with 3'-5' exonuclease and polymerase domains